MARGEEWRGEGEGEGLLTIKIKISVKPAATQRNIWHLPTYAGQMLCICRGTLKLQLRFLPKECKVPSAKIFWKDTKGAAANCTNTWKCFYSAPLLIWSTTKISVNRMPVLTLEFSFKTGEYSSVIFWWEWLSCLQPEIQTFILQMFTSRGNDLKTSMKSMLAPWLVYGIQELWQWQVQRCEDQDMDNAVGIFSLVQFVSEFPEKKSGFLWIAPHKLSPGLRCRYPSAVLS